MNTGLFQLLTEEILTMWPADRWVDYHVLVAVSGGADSVALMRALVEIRERLADKKSVSGSLIVCHFNHKLRNAESEADAEFVRQLSANNGLPFHLGEATDGRDGSENLLREQRYEFLQRIAKQTNSRYIVTAHHRDDQVETVLFRMFRGTGLRGICGIPFSRVIDESITLVRPMLGVERETIERVLRELDQSWRDDATNAESNYTRNFLRNEILPQLRDRFPAVDESLARLSRQTQEHCDFLEEAVKPLWASVEFDGDALVLDCASLAQSPRVLLRELFMQIYNRRGWPTSKLGFEDVERATGLVFEERDVPVFQLPGGINASKRNAEIRLTGA